MNRPSNEEIARALHGALGQASRAAERLGCPIELIYRRARASRRVRSTLRFFRGKLLDLAETAVWKGVAAGEPWAVKLAFDLWGRSRAFTDGGEVWHEPGQPADDIRPELVRQLAEEMLKHVEFTEACRAGRIGFDPGDVRPAREPGEVADGAAPGGDRPGPGRDDSGTNGADPDH